MYEETVKALKICAKGAECDGCKFDNGDDYSLECLKNMMAESLTALETLSTENARLTVENKRWEEINDTQAEQLGVAYGKTAELLAENKTLRGELCLHCGKYVNSHLGLCNNCRWRDSVDANKMEG